MEAVIEHISALHVIPFATVNDATKAIPLAQALKAGGCDVVSISFRSKCPADAIQAISTEMPEIFVGAGSVLSVEDVSAAHVAGARFAMAPGFDPLVVDAAAAAVLPFIPGILTPANLSRGLVRGCRVQAFFPAAPLGVAFLDSVLSAFRHTGIKIVATGGINSDTIMDWLSIPDVVACGVSWICPEELIESENWAEITRRTIETLDKVHAACAFPRHIDPGMGGMPTL